MKFARFASSVCAFACALVVLSEEQNPAFTYKNPSGIIFTVTENGLSSVTKNGKEIAKGGLYAWNAGPGWFGAGKPDEAMAYPGYSADAYKKIAGEINKKTVTSDAADHAVVRHEYFMNAVATFDYKFSGEDVAVKVKFENNDAKTSIRYPALGGLCFTFANPPTGNMPVWHMSYLHQVREGCFHPSNLNKIGGTYVIDENNFGVGTSPITNGMARTLTFWDYDDWNPGRRDIVPVRWLTYIISNEIPPGAAVTFGFKMRVSAKTDWKHLLQPYKDYFKEIYGEVKYKSDFRAVSVMHANRNLESITPENPYGFHGGFRRLDLPEEVNKLCDLMIGGLKKADGQGLIIWGQGGEEPRGQSYRSDFDVLPPAVEKNFEIMKKRFSEAGVKFGVAARPSQMQIRLNWKEDGTININPLDPQHLEVMVWNRFKNMIDKGCTLFYLDSFGNTYEDVIIMKYLREKMGPDIQTFVEHQCDAIAPYSGFYSECDFWAKGSADWVKNDGWYPRTGMDFLEKARWLTGPVNIITRGYDVHGKIPDGFESTNSFFIRNGMSPMIEDYMLDQFADEVRQLQEKYLKKK